MSLHRSRGVESAGNLKYGDVILLYCTADDAGGDKSGFILADLSG